MSRRALITLVVLAVVELEGAGSRVSVVAGAVVVVGAAAAIAGSGARASTRPPATPPAVASTARTTRVMRARLLMRWLPAGALGGAWKGWRA